MSVKEKLQDDQYSFPYHNLVSFSDGNFVQTRNLRWGYMYMSYVRFLLKYLAKVEFESLLDVGCGDGKFLKEAYACFPDKRLAGVDVSERATLWAKAFNPDVQIFQADITNTDKLGGGFDVVTLIEVLEHIHPDEVPLFLESISRALAHKGKLILTVPSVNIPVKKKHYRHFDRASLEAAISGSFTVTEVFYLNANTFRSRCIKKLLSNSLYILNSRRMVNALYRYYEKNLLLSNQGSSRRLVAVCEPNA
jgi:SAM-dependent methyltransferase